MFFFKGPITPDNQCGDNQPFYRKKRNNQFSTKIGINEELKRKVLKERYQQKKSESIMELEEL